MNHLVTAVDHIPCYLTSQSICYVSKKSVTAVCSPEDRHENPEHTNNHLVHTKNHPDFDGLYCPCHFLGCHDNHHDSLLPCRCHPIGIVAPSHTRCRGLYLNNHPHICCQHACNCRHSSPLPLPWDSWELHLRYYDYDDALLLLRAHRPPPAPTRATHRAIVPPPSSLAFVYLSLSSWNVVYHSMPRVYRAYRRSNPCRLARCRGNHRTG
mmetsp:Transcript_10779/g.19546  ORF Transcript_10779/g.19546 Transcript_10779/m.19546 type:complete len:210 (-) Transcript_10779:1247-1876(-)